MTAKNALLRPLAFMTLVAFAVSGPPAFAVSGPPAFAEDAESPWFRRHHFVLGIGTGKTFENDVFNVGPGSATAASPTPAYDFAYAWNFNERWAIGVHLHGYSHAFHDYVSAQGGAARVRFELDTYNQALRVQRFFARGRLQPYAYVQAGLANGQVQAEGDKLKYAGASVGAGAGTLLALTKYFGLSADAILSAGSAKWEDKPFAGSSDRSFNPSYWAIALGAAVMIP